MKLKPKLCEGLHRFQTIEPVWIESPYPQYPLMAGPGYLYRCTICKHEIKYPTMFGEVYRGDYVSAMEYQRRKWITSLAKTGIYPSSEFTRPGD